MFIYRHIRFNPRNPVINRNRPITDHPITLGFPNNDLMYAAWPT